MRGDRFDIDYFVRPISVECDVADDNEPLETFSRKCRSSAISSSVARRRGNDEK